MGAHSTADGSRRTKGKHRAQSQQSIERYAWLGAGAVTLGVGAAMAGGMGVASAETGSDDGKTPNATQSSPEAGKPGDGATKKDTPKKKPKSSVGSGRDESESNSAGSSDEKSAKKDPLSSLADSANTVRTAIRTGVSSTSVAVRKKVADDLDELSKLAPIDKLDKLAQSYRPDLGSKPDPFAPVVKPAPADDPEPVVEKAPVDDAASAVTLAAEPDANAGPVPWSPNPFRPMPPEPAPVNMPDVIWNVEQNILNAFDSVPGLQPFVREGFELGFRGTQFIPWVNAVIPAINILGQLPNVASGDEVVRKDATQLIVNNLLVTIHPVSVLFYGYDEIADIANVEYEGQQLKEWFYRTSWDLLDPFTLLHNKGQTGLPLSGSTSSESSADRVVILAAASKAVASTDDPLSNPFRENDPDPRGMPVALLGARDAVMAALPGPVDPIFREAFEFVHRGSQMVPYVNAVVPITEILPALAQAAGGDKAGAQLAINQLILTTGPVSVLYYGYDQIADVLNVEDAAFAAKEQLYIGLWDAIDSGEVLHNKGESGLLDA